MKDTICFIAEFNWYDITKDLILPIINIIAIGIIIPVVIYRSQAKRNNKQILQNELIELHKNYFNFHLLDSIIFETEVLIDLKENCSDDILNVIDDTILSQKEQLREKKDYNLDWHLQTFRIEMILKSKFKKIKREDTFKDYFDNKDIRNKYKIKAINKILETGVENIDLIKIIITEFYQKYTHKTSGIYLQKLYDLVEKY